MQQTALKMSKILPDNHITNDDDIEIRFRPDDYTCLLLRFKDCYQTEIMFNQFKSIFMLKCREKKESRLEDDDSDKNNKDENNTAQH